ncbi:MAG: O-antigen ligase family protein [Patescibacteria group bacterium]
MNRTDAIKWLKAIVYVGIYGGLLVPLMFVPVVIFPFVFSKLIFFQILIGLTFPAYMILAWAEPKYRPRWVPLYSAIVAYFIAVGLSVVFAVDPLRAWWGNQERMNGLFTMLHFLAWLTMTTSLIKTWSQWKKLLIYEIALSGIMASVALLQKPFPKLLMFPAGDRVGGLLDNPIYMAAYQIFNLFFIVLLWLKGKNWGFRSFLIIMAVLDISAFIAAQSRGALVGLFAAIGIFALTYAILTPNKKAKFSVVGLACVVVASYGLLFSLRNTEIISHSPLARLTNFQVTTATRFIAWKIGWQGFLERPLTGWGFDNFHIIFNQKYNPVSLEYGYYETWFDRAHNTVIDMLAMTGIFGFLTFFAIFGALFYSVLQAYRKKWIDIPTTSVFIALPIGYFVQNLFVFDQPAGFSMSYLMYALIATATAAQFSGAKDDDKPAVEPSKGRAVPWIGFAIVQLIALLIVWRYSYLPVKASYITIKANNYFSAGALPVSFNLAKQAAAIPTPYLDEQTFLQSRNLISLVENGTIQKFPEWKAWHDLILDITKRHLQDHPNNTHPHFIFARFLHAFSNLVPEDAALAEKEYQEAIRTSPKRQQLLYSLARFYLEKGRKQDGLDLFKQAMSDDPNVGESHWYVGISEMFDFGQMDAGAKEMVAAINAKAPYYLKDVREAVALGMAYVQLGDKAGFKTMLNSLSNLGGATPALYLELARSSEKLGMIEERNLLLGAISQADPSINVNLAPLQNGSATSIEESFRLTASATPAVQPTPQLATSSAETSSGGGPRKK